MAIGFVIIFHNKCRRFPHSEITCYPCLYQMRLRFVVSQILRNKLNSEIPLRKMLI